METGNKSNMRESVETQDALSISCKEFYTQWAFWDKQHLFSLQQHQLYNSRDIQPKQVILVIHEFS